MIEKISVIIPTYNRARFICRAVESVLNQTYRNFEVIVVDDGSKDDTRQLLKKFHELPNFRYLYQVNKGRSIARNEGVKNATGNWIMHLDSDDYLEKNALQKLYDLATEAKDSPIVFATPLFLNGNNETYPFSNQLTGKALNSNLFLDLLENRFCLTKTGTYLLQKNIALGTGGFSTGFEPCEDLDYSIRLLYRVKASYINDVVLYVERHSENTDETEITKTIIKICKHYLSTDNEWKQQLKVKEIRRANCALKLRIANGSYELNKHKESFLFYSSVIRSNPVVIFDKFILKQFFASMIPWKIKKRIRRNKKINNLKY